MIFKNGTVNNLKDISSARRIPSPPNLRLTKRQLQAMETKDKLYNAAVAEINRKGFSNVSIEDITTAANVAKGTFYTHFESKEALVFYTFTHSDDMYRKAYEKVRNLDFLNLVTRFVRISYIEYEKRGKGIIKAIITNYFSMTEQNVYSKDRYLVRCLGDIVERGKAEGVLSMETETDRYVSILLSTMVGVEVMWCFDNQGLSLANMMEDAVRAVARGMMK